MLTAIATHGNTLTTPALDLTSFTVGHPTARPVVHETCTRPIPCSRANYTYASQRCGPCFDRWLAELDAASEARAVAHMDMGLDGYHIIDGVEIGGFEPSADDLAEWRAEGDHDGFDGDDELSLLAHSWTAGEWAEEFLDPERELAEMMMERDAVREMEG